MSGLIGGLLRDLLDEKGGYELSALNRRPVDGVKCLSADIGDLEAIKPAFEGVDVAVHLAAYLKDEPFETLARTNLIGTYNVFEASRLAGVKRVIFASSGSTVRGFDTVPPYDVLAQAKYDEAPESWPMLTGESSWPDGVYGASKIWGEALARRFADAYDMSMLCVRIGTVFPNNRPPDRSRYWAWLSHRDVADILRKCIDASDDLKYEIFFATSADRWGYRDLEHPRLLLGWQPHDSVDDFWERSCG